MKKLFDITAIVAVLAWLLFNVYQIIGPILDSAARSVIPQKILKNVQQPRHPEHYDIPVADENAIGSQRVPIRLQQQTSTLPPDKCLAEGTNDDFELVVLGVNEGKKKSAFEVEDSGEYESVSIVNVVGSKKGKDLVLVISAYNPVIWNFENFPTHRLRMVLAYGHNTQAVANLPEDIAVRFVTEDNSFPACGKAGYAYEGGRDLDLFAKNLESATGKRINRFQGGYNPDLLEADVNYGFNGSYKKQSDWKIRASGLIMRRSLPSGQAGINQLLKIGALRLATTADVQAWQKKAALRGPQLNNGPLLQFSTGAYVVEKPIEIPSGFTDRNRITYIVKAGVPRPRKADDGGRFYYLETGTLGY